MEKIDGHWTTSSRRPCAMFLNYVLILNGNARSMRWIRRLLLAVPFTIAALLNALMVVADRLHLHREHIAGYGFLFGTPWAWLLDRGWIPSPHSRLLYVLVDYATILWIPALLYSGCI